MNGKLYGLQENENGSMDLVVWERESDTVRTVSTIENTKPKLSQWLSAGEENVLSIYYEKQSAEGSEVTEGLAIYTGAGEEKACVSVTLKRDYIGGEDPLPIEAACGDYFMVMLRVRSNSNFTLTHQGVIYPCVDFPNSFVREYAFISKENYLNGVADYRIITEP